MKRLTQLQRLAIAPSQMSAQQAALTAEQQHYLSRVLRLKAGDRFIILDGRGWWLAEIGKHLTSAQLLEPLTVQTEIPIEIILMVALPKGNGMDEVVRQTTEMGVTSIVPVISDRTLLNPSPQKLDRWRRIVKESAEQSERQILPKIFDPIALKEGFKIWNQTNSSCYICTARGESPHLSSVLDQLWQNVGAQAQEVETNRQVVVATGPEGGWTDAEVTEAIAAGYQPVSLGRRILRAVTAPLVALSLVASVFEATHIIDQ